MLLNNMSKSVIIVDDHLLFARSLKIMVESFDGYSVTSIFGNGQELIDHLGATQERPDVILLDIKMPVMNGLETMTWIRQYEPQQKVLALSMEDDEATVLSMIRQGVKGYLLKDIDPEEFRHALDSLMCDGYYHSDLQKKTLKHESSGKLEKLNDKEQQFLQLACTELTYREIAEVMGRSYKTIDGYRDFLFKKLNVKSRTGLVMYAVKHNLVNL